MSCKTIIAVASGTEEDERVFAAAAKLGAKFAGSVIVAPAYPDATADYVSYGVALAPSKKAAVIDRVRTAEKDAQEGLETLGRAAAEREGLAWKGEGGASFDVRPRELQPIDALKTLAPLADITLFGASAARDAFALGDLFAETLLGIGAPILLVGSGAFVLSRAAIAWDGSFQAARAVRAALPLLQAATSTSILTNSDDAGAEQVDLKTIKSFLEQRGVSNITSSTVRGENIANSLLECARAQRCGLLAAGAFGRPRLLEIVLGGTTRALVNAPEAPHILLAH